jgi:hypothetical protein
MLLQAIPWNHPFVVCLIVLCVIQLGTILVFIGFTREILENIQSLFDLLAQRPSTVPEETPPKTAKPAPSLDVTRQYRLKRWIPDSDSRAE